jgi:formate dehydrogenase
VAGSVQCAIPTRDGKVQLAPAEVLEAVPREAARLAREAKSPPALRLIGRRQRRSHNSWMHNLPRLRPRGSECALAIHPIDARARNVTDGAQVVLSSPSGRLEVPAQYDEDLMPGTVSLPHGWGHAPAAGWRIAAREGQSGVNVNLLAADGPAALEPLSGMARFNGIEVEVAPVTVIR